MFYICGCDAQFVINSLFVNSGLPSGVSVSVRVSRKTVLRGGGTPASAGGLLDGVPEDLPGRSRSSGWELLVMGHHAWREIAFGVPSLRLRSEGCSCTDDCHVQD